MPRFHLQWEYAFASTAEKTIKVIVENPWNTAKTDEPVVIDIHSLNTGFTVKSAVVKEGTMKYLHSWTI